VSVSQASIPDRSPSPARRADGRATARQERLASLLQAAQAGQREALDAIVAELSPLVWHIARSQGLGREASEDVVQTTWLTLLGHLAEIRSPSALSHWLVTVARREAWRVSRARRREPAVADTSFDHLHDPYPGPEERSLADEQRRLLWEAVGRLPERCRRLLRIVAFVPRPPTAAVATTLGWPVGSVGPTRGRCLAKLRAMLAADPQWSEP
jgi:RNA polymerase sigma factor (sigma-70 family)